jgi:hypothetical protein
MVDYKEYQKLYKQLVTDSGLASVEDKLGEKEKVLKQINDFLGKYPTIIPPDRNPSTPVYDLSLKEVYRRTLQTAIDIINDISELITQKKYIGDTTFRRKMFEVFTKPERRLYVGIMLILLSFLLYFIDSSA